jgi:hypothetical protein
MMIEDMIEEEIVVVGIWIFTTINEPWFELKENWEINFKVANKRHLGVVLDRLTSGNPGPIRTLVLL